MVDDIKDFEVIRSFAILKPEKLNCMDPVELEFLSENEEQKLLAK